MQTIVTDVRDVCQSVTNALNKPGSASLCGVMGGGACSVLNLPLRGSFDAAFAECLWPLVVCVDIYARPPS